MTELYIAGMPVVLPPGFNISLIQENPFFTKSGQYTYDINLSLEIEQNAKVYMYLHRLNKKDSIPTRSAYLVVDNEVVINGTENILEWTDTSVSIQLLSGNSELNFLIGGDQKVRSLNLGTAVVYPGVTNIGELWKLIYQDLHKSYPARDWQLIPFASDESVDKYQEYNALFSGNSGFIETNPWPEYPGLHFMSVSSYSRYTPQPYFLFIIKKVVESLGYQLTYNSLESHPRLKNMYIVNGLQTLSYAEMLPDWTVADFLSKVELQFNCVFVVDSFNKSVRLLYKHQFDYSSNAIYLNVLDEYEVKIEKERRESLSVSNIGYSLTGEEFYNRMKLSEFVLTYPVLRVTKSSLSALISDVSNPNNTTRFRTIYTVSGIGEFIAWQLDNGQVIPVKANSFKNLNSNPDSSEQDIEFDIIPASMVYTYLSPSRVPNNPPTYWLQLPVASPCDPLRDPFDESDTLFDDGFSISEAIAASGSQKRDIIPDKIRVAIYEGMTSMTLRSQGGGSYPTPDFPNAYVEGLAEYFGESGSVVNFCPAGQDPFRLENLNRDIYSESAFIDTTKIYRLTFLITGPINLMSRFVANNKTYLCVKLERQITSDGISNLIEGEFYALD